MKNKRYCFIDFETTGLSPFEDYPIQLGAVLVDFPSFKIIKEGKFNLQIPKDFVMSQRVIDIHGVTDAEAHSFPDPELQMKAFFKSFGTNYSFAAWNVKFDLPFMQALCMRTGLTKELRRVNYLSFCPMVFAQGLIDANLLPLTRVSLNNVAEYFNLSRKNNTHDALEDAWLAMETYKAMLEYLKPKPVTMMKQPRVILNSSEKA